MGVLLDMQNLVLGCTGGWNGKQERHKTPVLSPHESTLMPWNTLTFDFWHMMVAVATVLADSQGLCSKEVA